MKTFVIGDSKTGVPNVCLRLDLICAFFRNQNDAKLVDILYSGGDSITIELSFEEFLARYEQALKIGKWDTSKGMHEVFE